MAASGKDARRRAVAVVVVFALVLLAAVLAVLLRTGTSGPPPSASPSASVLLSPSASLSASASPAASPTESPGSGASVPAPETGTPEAGQTPVEPPAVPPEPPSTQEPPALPFPASLLGQDLTVVPGAGRVVALTFDAGANPAGLPTILSALSAKGATGTFFLTGNWAANNPQAAQIAAAGHRVGNHSMTHPGFTGLSDFDIASQVRGAEQAILAAGADPRPFFRFPYGERDSRTIAAVNGLGYIAVRWTVDTLGWKGTSGGASVQSVADRALAGLQPGEIVLMHIGSNPDDGTTLDADALPQVIDRIRAAGYGFTTLDALLGPS
ncbi:polysaccharide deacetylase family protein [Arthrobacter sp. C152]